jgi:hypothetical protein
LHEEGQDGKLDMVFICYRRWYLCEGQIGECSFYAEGWYPLSLPDGSVDVDGGQRQIISEQGVNVLRMMQYPRLEHLLHEFGHVWGLPHNYSGGLWTLMGHRSSNISSFMNSYERERLGWIYFTDVTQDGYNATIADFGKHGVAYRILIPNTNEAFLFENHQCVRSESPYDLVDVSDPSGAKGLYVLQQKGNELRVAAADGRWNWSNPFWIQNPWSTNPLDSIPVYKRGSINRHLGYTKKVGIPHTKPQLWNGLGFMHAWLDEITGDLQIGPRFKGDGKDRFTYEENNVFSPWSHYGAYSWNGSTATTIGFEITSPGSSNINVKFYTANPQNASPSKPVLGWDPRDLGKPYEQGWVYLAWGADFWDEQPVEPDITWSELQRKIGFGSWQTVYSGPNRVWEDGSINYDPNGETPVYLRVRWKDSQNKWSLWSDLFSTKMNNGSIGVGQKSISQNPDNRSILEYGISQNYPNPFNPVTTITFSIKESGLVSLKVFDVLGKEVITLINEFKPEGEYKTKFDASALPSGIYFYTLQVNEFIENRKMLLLK